MREIQLTQGQVALVDDDDYEYLMQWKWGAWWNRDTKSYYARRNYKNKKTFLMHRVVAKTPDGKICDHRNHNTLDNRKTNLRNVTPSQSNLNRKPESNSLGEPCIRIMGSGFEVRTQNSGRKLCKTYSTLSDAIYARDSFKASYGDLVYKGES